MKWSFLRIRNGDALCEHEVVLSWEMYYEKNRGRPLRPLFVQAIQFVDSSASRAVDLGCGVGTEVADLLQRGFEVHAVDQEPKSIELVKLNSLNSPKLHTHLSSLETWKAWPTVDFLFAYHSFPFCDSKNFISVIEKAFSSLSSNGILAVSFFGPEDQWVVENKVVGISESEIKKLLSNFQIIHFEEIKKVGPTALQGDKMWNVIEVIARKIE